MPAPLANKSQQPASTIVTNNGPPGPNLRVATADSASANELAALYHDYSFWGMNATQFLGAFNDNLFKQLVLLLSIAAVGIAGVSDRQGLAMFIFTVPFLAFTGYAGYLADRWPKRTIVVACKVAEIGVMALGAVAFAVFESNGRIWPLFVVLFFMGADSAFFGPAQLGILPELPRPADLSTTYGFRFVCAA